MSSERIPIVQRPVVADGPMQEFQAALPEYGIQPYAEPMLYLLLVGEVHTARALSCPDMVAKGIDAAIGAIKDDGMATADIIGTRVFKRRGGRAGKHFVALDLGVDMLVAEERKQLLEPFAEAGINVRRRPFDTFAYTALVAESVGSIAMTYDKLGAALDRLRPEGISLEAPQPKH